jgi:hypothetical protein
MATNTTAQQPKALRGEVVKRYDQVKTLAGFMDDAHFRAFSQEYLLSLSAQQQRALLGQADRARQAVSQLPPHTDFAAEARPLEAASYDSIIKDKTFQTYFGQVPHRFAWIKLENLVALQVYVRSQKESVPATEQELVDFALPKRWDVPAEISFMPPLGPIYIVSSSPQMVGLNLQMDGKKSQVIISPAPHLNLIQVVQLYGRYYLKNGYHRVVGALEAGVKELPALVIDAAQPADVELANLGQAGFGVGHSMLLARPPLVSEFNGTGIVEISMLEKRYGASVSLQTLPINIGV